ncbi:ABC transporter permease [Pseudactinotalea sp. HY158]|uniref:ABC transporter permease n=1 Tax=Pseudactinotalea sp. HY158 TaxID=2654547 RepID=UPI001E3AF8D6|nr:ABC transporter permease [Pseudactinotalea sp. HY158]
MPLIVLVVAVASVTVAHPAFLGVNSLTTVLNVAAPIIILAVGQTFPILTGGIDLSQAAVTSLGTVIIALTLPSLGGLGIVFVLLCTTLIGVLNGVIAVWAQIPTFIVTLGGLTVWGAVAMVISGATTLPLGDSHGAIAWITARITSGLTVAPLLAITLTVLVALVIQYGRGGRAIHYVGLGEAAAQLAGVATRRARILAFGAAGLSAGIAALVISSTQYSGAPTLADSLLLPVIAAVVLGGTALTGGIGGPLRSLVGALTIAVLRVGLGIAGVDPAIEQIIYGCAIIIAVAITIDKKKWGVVK